MTNFYFDLPNYIACLLLVAIASHMRLIPLWIAIVLGLQSMLPYLLNDVLFPVSYMPDQIRYFNMVSSIRSFSFNEIVEVPGGTVYIASWMLSFIPLPYVETVNSLGFFNRFIFIILFIWIYNKKFLQGLPLYFILFMPSTLLYTSLSLRDTLILCFMVVSIISFIEKRYITSLTFSIPLFFIKYQCFYFIIIFFLLSIFSNLKLLHYKYRYSLYAVLLILTLLFVSSPQLNLLIERIDFYRGSFFIENIRAGYGDRDDYIALNTTWDFIVLSLIEAPYYLIKPSIFEAQNLLQYIQSIENMVVLVCLILMTSRCLSINMRITIKWMIYFFITMAINGIVVSNFGTAARYRFPLILLYVIGLYYEIYQFSIYQYKYRITNLVNSKNLESKYEK